MVGKALGTGLLGIALLFWTTLPAVAADTAAKIKSGVEWYLSYVTSGYPGVRLEHEVEVTPVGEEYELAVRGLTLVGTEQVEGEANDRMLLGDYFSRVKLQDDGNYRFHSVRVPEEIRIENPQNAAEFFALQLGLEKFEGVVSPATGFVYAHDFLARDLKMTFNGPVQAPVAESPESVVMQIAEVSSTSDFEMPRENALDQDIVFNLRDLFADFGEAGRFRVGSSTTNIAVSLNDVAAISDFRGRFATFAPELTAGDPQGDVTVLREMVGLWKTVSKYVQSGKAENITFDNAELKLGVESSRFDFGALDLDSEFASQDLLISARGFFVSLPDDPAMDAALQMLPRRWTLPVKFQRVPVKAMIQEAEVLLSRVSSTEEIDRGGPEVEAFNARIKDLFREAGTTILFDGQSLESDVVTATMDGLLKINPDNPIGLEGSLSAQVLGLTQLIEKAETLENPQAQQQLMQGALLLLFAGETEPGNQVPSVTNYLFEFTPLGAILLNGNEVRPPPGVVH